MRKFLLHYIETNAKLLHEFVKYKEKLLDGAKKLRVNMKTEVNAAEIIRKDRDASL